MNGESDQPPAVLIGTGDEFGGELELPLEQLKNTGNAKEIRLIPDARIFEAKLDASNDMTFPRLM
jgi:hypothetical protein